MRVARPSAVGFTVVLALLLGGGVALVGLQAAGLPPRTAWLGLIPFVLVLWFGLRGAVGRWRVVRAPLPAASRDWLSRHVPLYNGMDESARSRFERDVQIALAEAQFEGVGGVEVTDELRLSVAAGVALLLHGRPDWELQLDRTFLFYPGHFGDDYSELEPAYDGMVHPQGPVILSAPAIAESWSRADGSNVVLHELAHLFDYDDLDADGVPSLVDPGSVEAWTALVRRETALIRRGRSMLRRYAATNPAEFFAVATEVFFERPVALAERHPELFETLVALYNLDPRAEGDAPPPSTDGPTESLMARRWR
jgi:Mlc titration factor MtfA (ptsG expression regulator)